MPSRTLMVQGTGSHVGKSLLVTALGRIFRQDGLRVAPFKAQNMSNNSFVCRDGGEIARSQTLQAMACGVAPAVEMNPVLLKPCTDSGSQVIVMGRPVKTMNAREYQNFKPSLIPTVQRCLGRLRDEYDLVLIEGAGSPAEINLRESDIVNMKTAALADAPVILVGDIDFGGVFAQLVGTLHLLLEEERARICGFVINKFRGDPEILKPGLDYLEAETGQKVLGVLPFYQDIRLPEEDSVPLWNGNAEHHEGSVRIDVIRHPRISNFTDFDALKAEPDVSLRYVDRPDDLLPDALLLPGTKSTIPDLRRLKSAGFPEHVARCREQGVTVAGICGGFQMMGRVLRDPDHIESETETEEGLGLLPMETVFDENKQTAQVRAIHIESGAEVSGYEIHMGKTRGEGKAVFRIVERLGKPASDWDGASTDQGRVWGTYIHGVFDSGPFRRRFINALRARKGLDPLWTPADTNLSGAIDQLADRVRADLDIGEIYKIVRRAP